MNRENRLIFRDIDRPSDEDLADEFDRQDRQEYASLDNFNEEFENIHSIIDNSRWYGFNLYNNELVRILKGEK